MPRETTMNAELEELRKQAVPDLRRHQGLVSRFWSENRTWAWQIPVNAFTVTAHTAPWWIVGGCGVLLALNFLQAIFWAHENG